MIQILVGKNFQEKNTSIKKITKDYEILFFRNNLLNKEVLLSYAKNGQLFENQKAYIISRFLEEQNESFSEKEIEVLKESDKLFIFKEDKMSIQEQNKFKKYAKIDFFIEEKKNISQNNFIIADWYAKRNKIEAWICYQQAIERGVEPEAIVGILFWKIKTMILGYNKFFTKEELKKQISDLVTLYHRAHRGEIDFLIGLEHFILNALT